MTVIELIKQFAKQDKHLSPTAEIQGAYIKDDMVVIHIRDGNKFYDNKYTILQYLTFLFNYKNDRH